MPEDPIVVLNLDRAARLERDRRRGQRAGVFRLRVDYQIRVMSKALNKTEQPGPGRGKMTSGGPEIVFRRQTRHARAAGLGKISCARTGRATAGVLRATSLIPALTEIHEFARAWSRPGF
jgi:hypothetical protein